jgi:hypothetical protein
MLLYHGEGTEVCWKTRYFISYHHAHRKYICEIPFSQQENQFMLHHGEIDHGRRAGIHSVS